MQNYEKIMDIYTYTLEALSHVYHCQQAHWKIFYLYVIICTIPIIASNYKPSCSTKKSQYVTTIQQSFLINIF